MARHRRQSNQTDLFSLDTEGMLPQRLDQLNWPDQERFPVNRASAKVRTAVWSDLESSTHPLMIAGYSSIGELISVVEDWTASAHQGQVRIVLGTEPFHSVGRRYAAPEIAFTREVEDYWLRQGISLRQSSSVLRAIEAIDNGTLQVRFVYANSPLHAKVYVGSRAATIGSSNFTKNGLQTQVEANARFERADDPKRYEDLARVGENFWAVAQPWNDEFRLLLEQLLSVVSWQEALARACGELLEGDWAARYLTGLSSSEGELWPSQRIGIAQAMWIIENVGSVLVADATGSGKTRMGAQLVKAVRDRLWATGRVRRDLTVLVCPPGVENTWRNEAVACGLSINTVSHGKLSRVGDNGPQRQQREVQRAQLLAVDEAHNFLNQGSKRTRFLRENYADHVMLFTATPISRGPSDLLDLIALLGPDNFEDATLEILDQLSYRRGVSAALAPSQAEELRREIQRFTLRRTKNQINQLVDRDPEAYRHDMTNRICRYPVHLPKSYLTGETEGDIVAAEAIRAGTASLLGLTLLPRKLIVPKSFASSWKDEQWLNFRLKSAHGLAVHHVLGALRSSRAALYEHLLGTSAAIEKFGLIGRFKGDDTGNVLHRLEQIEELGPPVVILNCDLPEWLTDKEAWTSACDAERSHYVSILDALATVSGGREDAKARLLSSLAERTDRVLAFDHHLITLAIIKDLLADCGVEVLTATGQSEAERKKVERIFAPTESGRAIALCSDAMSEGLNLQGAAAIVHLDLPTTLRVAEQRVGRVDRMDTRHDTIEAWWPRDGTAFATRANERLALRIEESNSLLGSNLPMPDLREGGLDQGSSVEEDAVVSVEALQRELDRAQVEPWDEIGDALDPVRRLVEGNTSLIPQDVYDHYRQSSSTVIARIAPLQSEIGWAFFAVRSSSQGAPRWMLVEPNRQPQVEATLSSVADRLREHLQSDPQNRPLDQDAEKLLDRCIDLAAQAESQLMPRRLQRALSQMSEVLTSWTRECQRLGHEIDATRWSTLARIARTMIDESRPDPYAVAERWLNLVAPKFEEYRSETRRTKYVLLRDITPRLIAQPFDLEVVEEAFSGLEVATPMSERIAACILGVPSTRRSPGQLVKR
jgi:hypothetical protein